MIFENSIFQNKKHSVSIFFALFRTYLMFSSSKKPSFRRILQMNCNKTECIIIRRALEIEGKKRQSDLMENKSLELQKPFIQIRILMFRIRVLLKETIFNYHLYFLYTSSLVAQNKNNT